MAEKKKYNSILISGRKDQTLTYSKYVKDEESGESVKESLDKKVNVTDELTTQQIKDGAITNEKMAAGSVGNTNLQDGSVSNEKLEDGSITNEKLAENSITKDKLKDNTIGVEKLDPELRQTINAATGLPEDLVETIQNVDDTLKDHQSQLDDKQSQIDDKQQQITANDEDITLLQNRSTQMEETIKSIAATGGASQATAVTYNNEKSGLIAVNAQAAIDEVDSKLIGLSRFANDGKFLDFEEFTKDKLQKIGAVIQGKYINNGIWTDSIDALCVLIPATNIAKVTFYAKSNSCEYAFLQNNTQTPTFCNNTTINSLKARHVVSVEIPADCAFIYVCAYRGGTSLLSGITLFSKNAILNAKSPIVPTGVLDLAKFQNINYGGDAPFLYPDKTRAQIFIPCSNIEYLKITADNLYRVAIIGYKETINNIFSIVPTAVGLTYTDGINGGVAMQNVTKTCFIPENVGTLRLWIRKDDDSDLSLDDLNSHIRIEFISSIDNNLDKAKVAACSTLINTVVYVDTEKKKIVFPSTFAILYGRQQTKSYAFTSVTVVDYDIIGIGDYCKIVFNPKNDTKLYVVDRSKPLEAEEYYICGIYKPTGFLTLPAYQYCVDGKQYNSYIRRQFDTIMYYDGDKINLPIKKRNSLALTRIGQSAIINECYYNNELYYAQGMDTFKNYLFRLYYSASNKSLCKVYDIANILEPTLVDSFPLGYQGDYIHCNACQFGKEIDSETGFPLLYVRNGESGKCTVEKISLHSSELLQVINIDTSNIFTKQSESNIIIGDDGYLWLFGANNSKMFFAKFNVPNKSNGNVSLGKDNVVDSWEFEFQDSFTNKTWQGGKIYREHLYFLFGNNSISNRLYIFNTSTHELEKLLPLSAIQEECEDISFLEDSMLIGIDDTYNGIYKLNEL